MHGLDFFVLLTASSVASQTMTTGVPPMDHSNMTHADHSMHASMMSAAATNTTQTPLLVNNAVSAANTTSLRASTNDLNRDTGLVSSPGQGTLSSSSHVGPSENRPLAAESDATIPIIATNAGNGYGAMPYIASTSASASSSSGSGMGASQVVQSERVLDVVAKLLVDVQAASQVAQQQEGMPSPSSPTARLNRFNKRSPAFSAALVTNTPLFSTKALYTNSTLTVTSHNTTAGQFSISPVPILTIPRPNATNPVVSTHVDANKQGAGANVVPRAAVVPVSLNTTLQKSPSTTPSTVTVPGSSTATTGATKTITNTTTVTLKPSYAPTAATLNNSTTAPVKPTSDPVVTQPVAAHALNHTVAASPAPLEIYTATMETGIPHNSSMIHSKSAAKKSDGTAVTVMGSSLMFVALCAFLI